MLNVAGVSGGAGGSEHNISARNMQHWTGFGSGGDDGRKRDVGGEGDGDAMREIGRAHV